MSNRLEGKVALVFGAGSSGPGWGNGKAAAVAYAREGAHVVCIDVVEKAAEETATIIADEGKQALAVVADVTSADSVEAAIQTSLKRFGQIDIVHNNVGVTDMADVVELDEKRWQRSLDLNISSIYRICHAALPHMLPRRTGSIINISSVAAIRYTGYPYFSYYVTKGAVNQATVALALQYAKQGIRVNCIMPGMMDTPLIYKQISNQYANVEEMRAARAKLVPMGKMGDAWDIAAAAVFLASDEAKFITGVCLPVDGGQTCSMSPGA